MFCSADLEATNWGIARRPFLTPVSIELRR
jgi:hypothetical protein